MGTWAPGITFKDSMLSDGSEMVWVWTSNCYRPDPERRLWFKYMYLCSKCYRNIEYYRQNPRPWFTNENTWYRQYPWRWFRNDSICVLQTVSLAMVHKWFKMGVYAVTDRIPGDGSEMIQICLHAISDWYPRWWLSKFLHLYESLIKCLWGLSHTRQSTWLCLMLVD